MPTNFLQVSGGQIAYDDTGSGTTILCIPSMGDLRSEYRFITPMLNTSGYRVICMDVRGHGETSPSWPDYSVAAIGSDIIELLKHLNSAPAIVIATSMAAGAAVWAAAEAPECFDRLILIGPFVRGETTWQNRLLYRVLFSRPWGPAIWQKYYTSLYTTQKPVDFAHYIIRLRENLMQKGRMEALVQMMLASKSASADHISRVHIPAHILMGSRDPDFKSPESEASWVAEHLNASYQMIPGAGHYPHAEMPDITFKRIQEFLLLASIDNPSKIPSYSEPI